MAKIYTEVRIDFKCDGFWTIDAWKTEDDNEEGKVVGVIHSSGDYHLFDMDARICENVADAVNEKVKEIKESQITYDNSAEVVDIYLDPNKHPKAFGLKKEELVSAGLSEKNAETFIMTTPIQMELFYSKDRGLFAVESEAVGNTDVYDPYTGIELTETKE
jgi:hypothetical protein